MGVESGANAFGRNILGAVQLRMQQDQYDKYNKQYQDSADREETRFNRALEVQRGKRGMPASYHDALKNELDDPQAQGAEGSPYQSLNIPSADDYAQPPQAGRLNLMPQNPTNFAAAPTGNRLNAMPGVTPIALPHARPAVPSVQPSSDGSPASAMAQGGGMDTSMPEDPSKMFNRPPRPQSPMMSRFSRPRYR